MATDNPPIEGKVAAVVTDKLVAINRGKRDGVKEGMKFGIYLELKEIRDPDDPKNVLGGLKFRKATIEISQAFERMSLGSLESRPIRSTSFDFNIGLPTQSRPGVEKPLVDSPDWTVRVGDAVTELPRVEEAKTKEQER